MVKNRILKTTGRSIEKDKISEKIEKIKKYLEDFNETTKMTRGTFNFLVDTLIHELEMHPHCKEIITIMQQQIQDDT